MKIWGSWMFLIVFEALNLVDGEVCLLFCSFLVAKSFITFDSDDSSLFCYLMPLIMLNRLPLGIEASRATFSSFKCMFNLYSLN